MSGGTSIVILWGPPVFALVAVFGAWIYYATRKAPPEKPLHDGRLYRCAACGRVYVEPRQVPMARCPACDRLNDAPVR
ncbi:MAG TPA: hypothetical protein PKE12_15565 [Kiritimatiellia bacterium]|nr:hypothetical protein [Kiritimatiellia bacterium]